MSIYGVGSSGYPATNYGYYGNNGYGKTQKATGRANTGGQMENAHVQKSEMTGGAFVLHYFDHTDGEQAVGAVCGRDYSATAYIPKDYDPNNPVYKVKVWDKDGNITERMVDISKVDPENSDFIDMFAYSSYLEKSGKCDGAQAAFIGSSGNLYGMGDRSYDDLFDKTNWMDRVKTMMQMQYDTGNLKGYMEYKKFWDFLEIDQTTAGKRTSEENRKRGSETASSNGKAEKTDASEENMTVYYNGVPVKEMRNNDKKYTDKDTSISYYVGKDGRPYITGEDAEKLKELCAETGEPFLKKMAEITGMIRYLDENTTAYIGDNGTAIKSKDGKELYIDTSSLSYDVLSYMFQNLGRTDNFFDGRYWSKQISNVVGRYLTEDF